MLDEVKKNAEQKMQKALESLKNDLAKSQVKLETANKQIVDAEFDSSKVL